MGAERYALLLLHFQNDVVHPEGRIPFGFGPQDPRRTAVLANAKRLLAAQRERGGPVAFVKMVFPKGYEGVPLHVPVFGRASERGALEAEGWGVDWYAGLEPDPSQQSTERAFPHQRVNAFFRTTLEEALDGWGVNHVVLAGVATNSVVEHSARHAADMGLKVTVVEDACACANRLLHAAALENIALLGSVRTTDEVLRETPA